MLKFIFLHLLKWTTILLISAIGLGIGIFFLDFKHALTDDPKLNFIYTSLLTVCIVPAAALLFGGLTLLKTAIESHPQAEEKAEIALQTSGKAA